MILFHAKRDGTVTTTPDLVPQGSSMQDLVVVSEFDYANCAIKLLPASGEYIEDILCDLVIEPDGLIVWTASLPPKATVVAGSVDYQLIFTAADGTTQTTLVGSFTVPRGVPVSTPPTVGELSSMTIGDIYAVLSNVYAMFGSNESEIRSLANKITTAGHITIPAADWTDVMPHEAFLSVPGDSMTKGGLLLLAPEDNATKEACARARISVDIDKLVDGVPPGMDSVFLIRAESGELPGVPLNFAYFAIRTNSEDQKAAAAIIGVDASGGGITEETKEELVKYVLAALPVYDGEVEEV